MDKHAAQHRVLDDIGKAAGVIGMTIIHDALALADDARCMQ
jgi:hypothetical protein